MNAVGIDVSKGKSTVAVMRPYGEVVAAPYDVMHTKDNLSGLAAFLKKLDGETRVIMEYTGRYYEPIAAALCEAGVFVCVVNSLLIHGYGNNSIRTVKTDKKDAIKLANYGLSRWLELASYKPEDELRRLLKVCSRQYNQYVKMKVSLTNNLVALTDQTFPNVRKLFTSLPRKADGHEKWVDFYGKFWHCECVRSLSENAFVEKYAKWCKREGYRSSTAKAKQIYAAAGLYAGTLPSSDSTKLIASQGVIQLNAISETLAILRAEMLNLAERLPEYSVVMAMRGVGEVLGPQLMAEIGDVSRFQRKQSLVAFAGVDAPPFQSGKYESKNRSISKRGAPALRKTLFQVMACLLQTAPLDDAVYQFIDKKRSEGKHFYIYMMAGTNKFLRIYYARVMEHLRATDLVA